MKRKIVSASQSPMNAKRWFVTFDVCGHETWVTSNRKPKAGDCLRVECNTADARARKK